MLRFSQPVRRTAIVLALYLCAGEWAMAEKPNLQSLHAEWRQAEQAHAFAIRAADSDEAREAVRSTHPGPVFAARFLESAERLKGEAAAEALLYATYAGRNHATGDQALELLARDHVDSRHLHFLFNSTLPETDSAEVLFRAVAERSRDRELKAHATVLLADVLKDERPYEAKILFERILREFPNVKIPAVPVRSRTSRPLRERAEQGLIFVEELSLGRPAPEIMAEDVEGRRFTLSDYRGSVVLIVFGFEACAPCRGLRPYERSLAERMKGRPFAMVEISSDSKSTVLETIARENITWPVVSDTGDIRQKWQIQGWPNLYLIDHEGIIRRHWVGAPGRALLDTVIDELVDRAERVY